MANTKVSIELELFDSASKEMVQAVKRMKQALDSLSKSSKEITGATNKMQSELKQTGKNMDQLKGDARELSAAIDKLSGDYKQNGGDAKKLSENVNKLESQFTQARAKANVLRLSLEKTGAAMKMAGTHFVNGFDKVQNLRKGFSTLSSRIEAAGGRMNVLGQRITFFVGLPLALFLSSVVKEAAKFDQQMIGIEKTTGLTDSATEEFGDSIRNLSLRIPVAREELAEIAEVAGRAGVIAERVTKINEAYADGNVELAKSLEKEAIEALTNYTDAIAKTSVALDEFEGNTKLITERVNQIGAIFSLPIEQTSNFASAMNELSNTTNTDAKKISEVLTRFSNAALFDIPIQDATAFAGRLTELGIIPSRAGTELNSAMNQMAKNLDSAAAAAGMTGDAFKEALDTDATGAILSVLDGLNKIESNTERNNASVDIFGAVGAKAMNGLAENVDILRERLALSRQAFEENTSITEEFLKASQGLEFQWQQLINIFDELKLVVFDALEGTLGPALQAANEILLDFITQIKSLDDDARNKFILLAVAIAGIVTAAGPLILFIGLIVTALGSIGGAIAALLSPAGVLGLTAAFIAVKVLFGEIFSSINILGGGFKGLGATALLVANAFGVLSDEKTNEFLERLGYNTDETRAQIEEARAKVEEWKNKIDDLIKKVKSVIDFIERHKNGIKVLIGFILILNSAYALLKIALGVSSAVKGLTLAFKGATAILTGGSGLISLITVLAGAAVLVALAAAIYAVSKKMQDLEGDMSAARKSIKNLDDVTDKAIASLANIKDPERKKAMEDLIKDSQEASKEFKVMDERYKGFAGVFNAVWDQLKIWWDEFAKGIVGMSDAVKEGISEIYNTIIDGLTGLASGAFEIGKNAIEGFIRGMLFKKEDAGQASAEVAGAAKEHAQSTLDQHSPSKVFEKIGRYTVEGFINGIRNSRQAVEDEISKLGEGAITKMADAIVENEGKLRDANKELQDELSKASKDQSEDRINTLRDEINEYKAILERNKGFIIENSDAVVEARRKAGRDEIQIIKETLAEEEAEVRKNALAKAVGDGIDAVKTAASGFKDAYSTFRSANKELVTNFKKTKREIKKEIDDLRSELKQTLSGIEADFKSSLSELQGNLNVDIATEIVNAQNLIGDNETKIAQEIVNAQNNVAEIKKKLATETNEDSIAELQSQLSTEQAFLSKHSDWVAKLQDKITEVKQQESLDSIDLLEQEINTQKQFLDEHLQDQKNLASQINEVKRQAGLDSIQILKETFATQKAELDAEKAQQIADAKAVSAEQIQVLMDQLETEKNMFKQNSNTIKDEYEKTAKKIRKAFKDSFEDINKTIKKLDANTLTEKFKTAIKKLNKFIEQQNSLGNIQLKAIPLESFATGGVVSGSFNQAKMIQAHGSEMVLNPRQQSNLFGLLSGKSIGASGGGVGQKVVNVHYHYSPEVGTMIATPGEQRDFMRRMRRLEAEENLRFGIDPNKAYDSA